MTKASIRHALPCLVLAADLLLAGCAATWTDADGARHVVGLVNLTIRPAVPESAIAGEIVETEIVGLGVYALPWHGGVVLGWSRDVSGALKNDVLVQGDPVAALAGKTRRKPTTNGGNGP